MSKVHVRNGTEGPHHDPYGFREYTVQRPSGVRAVLHVGLGTWARVRWRDEYVETEKWDERLAVAMFETACGVSFAALERAVARKKSRRYTRHACGQRYLRYAQGHPGESFVVCSKCGDVIDSHFDRSVVE
jgi:hypothetical protein